VRRLPQLPVIAMHKPLTFNERMELGKDLAMIRRNRGIPVSVPAYRDRPATYAPRSFAGELIEAQRRFRNATSDALAQYAIEASGDDYAIDVPFFVWRGRMVDVVD
jgi:hypothetical protein